jgi:hypothetical protein
MEPIDISEYLTIQQAMNELGCPRRTLSRAVSRAVDGVASVHGQQPDSSDECHVRGQSRTMSNCLLR